MENLESKKRSRSKSEDDGRGVSVLVYQAYVRIGGYELDPGKYFPGILIKVPPVSALVICNKKRQVRKSRKRRSNFLKIKGEMLYQCGIPPQGSLIPLARLTKDDIIGMLNPLLLEVGSMKLNLGILDDVFNR
jgi:hypothetical protein